MVEMSRILTERGEFKNVGSTSYPPVRVKKTINVTHAEKDSLNNQVLPGNEQAERGIQHLQESRVRNYFITGDGKTCGVPFRLHQVDYSFAVAD